MRSSSNGLLAQVSIAHMASHLHIATATHDAEVPNTGDLELLARAF
ncbi:hypothetical protein [Stutzerimonas stutzeri]|nr:hypothetical protein [Stutzerimonas stutzeri]MBA1263059.1 hypothetical protein [Stutzerimonas stutzeri]